MGLRSRLFLGSIAALLVFVLFSYDVAKQSWQKIDFAVTVKLQDHISRRFDKYFSYLSLLGSVEATFFIAFSLSLTSLIKKRFLAALGWLLIIPASFAEIFGKLVLFHPAPPEFLRRTLMPTGLPSFYIHTDFSYPSGHITRTVFLIANFILIIFFSRKSKPAKLFWTILLFGLAFLMVLTRIYLGEHWLSDVCGGVMLGVSAALFSAALIVAKKKKLEYF